MLLQRPGPHSGPYTERLGMRIRRIHRKMNPLPASRIQPLRGRCRAGPSFNGENSMNAKDAVQTALISTRDLFGWYLGDLSDADLLVRPVPGANHIAWQIGHLIASEVRIAKRVPGVTPPELPAGFVEQHGKDAAKSDTGFLTKAEYLALYDPVPEATL